MCVYRNKDHLNDHPDNRDKDGATPPHPPLKPTLHRKIQPCTAQPSAIIIIAIIIVIAFVIVITIVFIISIIQISQCAHLLVECVLHTCV